jgi:hypothetical protein
MSCRKILKPIGLFIVFVLSSALVLGVEPIVPVQKDVLLDLLPSDCAICVRVNTFQLALGQLDQYLAGATPMPMGLSMMAAMQLTGVFGDPLLTGINMQGNFAMAAVETGQEKKDLFLFFLVPSTGINAFLKGNTNLSVADANGVYTLKVPNSPIGNLAIVPLREPNYLLITRQGNQAELLAVKKALTEKKTSLKSKLDASVVKAAVENPAWAYVNLDKIYQLYGSTIKEGFDKMQKSLNAQMGAQSKPSPMKMEPFFEMFQYFAGQADWVTLSLKPTPQQMQMETVFAAKAGGELAGMLKPAPTPGKGWRYAGLLNDASSFKAICRLNKPLIQQLYIRMIDIFGKTAAEADKPQFEKMKALVIKSIPAMGDEVAMSFSYRAGMPPFEMKEVVHINDSKTMLDIQKEMAGLVTTTYAAMGMPMEFAYAPSVEKYKGIDVGLYQIKFSSKDPNDQTMKAVEMMYGKQGLQYPMAVTSDRFLLAMGPDAMNQIKAMIDAKQPEPAAGDMKTALNIIPNNAGAEMVASVNILKLAKGMSDMMGQQMAAQSGREMPNFWQGIDPNTTSCMAAATFVENGRVRGQLILPKEHLLETAKVMMQIQQQQMAYYMKQSQKSQKTDANGIPVEKKMPLKRQ